LTVGQPSEAVDAAFPDAAVDTEFPVARCAELAAEMIDALATRYGLVAVAVLPGQSVPASYWGAPEAGLAGGQLFWRPDTPVHSLLHELAHYVCMDAERRNGLDTDAGGDDNEECAVCYLEILLAEQLPGYDSDRCIADMDAWGYSFREGSARNWFEGDGKAARAWLRRHRLITAERLPSWRLRD